MVEENDSIKELLESNQQVLESLDKRLHKMENKFKRDTVLGVIKWLIIVVPIIFGVFYISPYVKQYAVYLEPAMKLLRLDGLQDSSNKNTSLTEEQKLLNSLCDPSKRAALVNQICK